MAEILRLPEVRLATPRKDNMKEDLIDLDEFLASRSFDVQADKLKIYEALLAQLLRKYVPHKRKIEINLMKAYTDTILDITLAEDGNAKISWGEDKC